MISHDLKLELSPSERTTLGAISGRVTAIGAVVGVAGLGVAILAALLDEAGGKRFMHAYLANFAFLLSISLGALMYVLIQHTTKSGASVTVRRVAELISANLLTLALMFLPILFGLGVLYKYWVPIPEGDELAAHKAPYLNLPFFFIRWIIFFAVWIGLAWIMLRRSRSQDRQPDAQLTVANQGLAPIGIVLVGVTLTFASFDLLKSLDAHWFSTMFGVYYFTGGFMGAYALMIVLIAALQSRGVLATAVNTEHYHDLGKMLFGFVVFWAYIAYSQYMLIWYANIPEETVWFIRHGASTDPADINAWSYVLVFLLFGHFVLPFLGLLSKHMKRRKAILTGWAVWLLAMHWLDMVWLVRPELKIAGQLPAPVNATDIICLVGLLLGLGGFYIAAMARFAGAESPVIAVGDPRLSEALAFENH